MPVNPYLWLWASLEQILVAQLTDHVPSVCYCSLRVTVPTLWPFPTIFRLPLLFVSHETSLVIHGYRSNTTCFLKKNSFGITVWVKSGKFLRYSRGRQKGSTDTLKTVGSRAVGLQIALPVLCGPTGLTLGCNLYREGWRGCWQLPQPCPERVHLPCLPYSLLSPLSISSLLFLPLTSQVNNMLGSWP